MLSYIYTRQVASTANIICIEVFIYTLEHVYKSALMSLATYQQLLNAENLLQLVVIYVANKIYCIILFGYFTIVLNGCI